MNSAFKDCQIYSLIITVLFFNFISLSAQSYSEYDINDEYLKIERISDNVIFVGSGSVYYTGVIGIRTGEGLVAIDAGISPVMTERYRKIIEQEFGDSEFIYLINTHGHYDHTTGNMAFEDIPIIAHDNCVTDIKGFWNDTSQVNRSVFNAEERLRKSQAANEKSSVMWNFYESLMMQISTLNEKLKDNFKITFPVITFKDHLNLYLKDVNLQLVFFGNAHTASDIIIYIPEEKILCIGDLFGKGGEPDFDILKKNKRWLEVMDWVINQEIEKLIYGHGLVLTKEDLIAFNNKIRE